MYPSEEELNQLFIKSLNKYKEGDFCIIHELWEDLWHNKQLKDRIFIQGLIQNSASFYKIHININVDKLKENLLAIQQKYNEINSTDEFSLETVPELN